MKRQAWMISVLLASACGGGGDGKGQPDAGHVGGTPDAAVPAIADAAPGAPDAEPVEDEPDAGPPAPQECVVPTAGFASVGALTMTASSGKGDVFAAAALDSGVPPDNLHIDLFPGVGAFSAGPITTGTFQLTGAEASWVDCGACVAILGDESEDGAKGIWMASGGTLTLTSVQGRLTGKLENATFVHVDQDDPATPLADSCNTSVTNATFDAPIVAEAP